jgi:hypothetical protein
MSQFMNPFGWKFSPIAGRAIAGFTVMAIGLGAAITALPQEASARDSQIYQKSYDLKDPLHGYEGHSWNRKYCTYKRFPKRECEYRGGKRHCKVVGWELEQTCY